MSGCESVVNITLSINSTSITNTTASTCPSTPYALPWGGTATTAGVYSHTYSTASGCDSVVNITLSINSTSITNTTASTCQGTPYALPWGGTASTAGVYSHTYSTASGCDSVVNLTLAIDNGTHNTISPIACVNYNWHGTTYTTSGTYVYSFNNSNGCLSTETLYLTLFQATSSSSNLSLCTSQLPYSWNGQSITSAGTYTSNQINSHGCDSIATLILTVNALPSAPIAPPTITYCQFENASPLSATGSYPLVWYSSISGGVGSPVPPVPTTNVSGVFHYYVSQSNGLCESPRANITVRVSRNPTLGADKEIEECFGTIVNLENTFNTTNLNSQWTLNQHPVLNPAFISTSGNYQLVALNSSGCSDTAVIRVTILPKVIANAGQDGNAEYISPYQLTGSGGSQYLWTQGASFLNNSHIYNPLATLTQDQTFVLMVENKLGCSDLDTVNIRVFKGPTFYIPNAFTPNGDGINDVFRPTAVGIKELKYFRIFNRYGEKVFETHDIGKGWDGSFRSIKQNNGNYVYVLEGIDRFGELRVLKGNFLLIR